MKIRKLALMICVAALVLALALCAGCGKKAPQTATFTMEANPTTGYTWQISQDNEIFDIAEEYVENEHAEQQPLPWCTAAIGKAETRLPAPSTHLKSPEICR